MTVSSLSLSLSSLVSTVLHCTVLVPASKQAVWVIGKEGGGFIGMGHEPAHAQIMNPAAYEHEEKMSGTREIII